MVASVAPEILLVEDEPLIRMGLADTCEAEGFAVAEASDGIEALSILRTQPSIRLVVTDIDMPRMDGLALVESLRTHFAALRIVMMSGKTYARTDLPREIPFFEKPVNERALMECLRALHIPGVNRRPW